MGWCVVRGVGEEVDRYVCGLLDIGVSGNVESGGGEKLELEVEGEVCYETFRSFCKHVKDEVNEGVGYIIGWDFGKVLVLKLL